MTNKEFKRLEKENDKLRTKIDGLLKTHMMSDEYEDTWCWINDLIENELKEEALCNE